MMRLRIVSMFIFLLVGQSIQLNQQQVLRDMVQIYKIYRAINNRPTTTSTSPQEDIRPITQNHFQPAPEEEKADPQPQPTPQHLQPTPSQGDLRPSLKELKADPQPPLAIINRAGDPDNKGSDRIAVASSPINIVGDNSGNKGIRVGKRIAVVKKKGFEGFDAVVVVPATGSTKSMRGKRSKFDHLVGKAIWSFKKVPDDKTRMVSSLKNSDDKNGKTSPLKDIDGSVVEPWLPKAKHQPRGKRNEKFADSKKKIQNVNDAIREVELHSMSYNHPQEDGKKRHEKGKIKENGKQAVHIWPLGDSLIWPLGDSRNGEIRDSVSDSMSYNPRPPRHGDAGKRHEKETIEEKGKEAVRIWPLGDSLIWALREEKFTDRMKKKIQNVNGASRDVELQMKSPGYPRQGDGRTHEKGTIKENRKEAVHIWPLGDSVNWPLGDSRRSGDKGRSDVWIEVPEDKPGLFEELL